MCWPIEYSILTVLSFRIWDSSTGIPSPPLALFVVMLLKAYLTSYSRMSGSGEWSHNCGYLGYDDLFCIVLLCILATSNLLLLLGPCYFCSLSSHLCQKCSLGISNFLEEISSLSHSIIFLYFFPFVTEEGFLISPCYSWELGIQMGISSLLCLSLLFFSQLFVRPLQATILPSCISFSWGWSWSLPPIQMSWTSVHSSSGTLPIRSKSLNLFVTSIV